MHPYVYQAECMHIVFTSIHISKWQRHLPLWTGCKIGPITSIQRKQRTTANQRLSSLFKQLGEPQDFWHNVLWIEQSKLEWRPGSRYIWRKAKPAFHNKTIIPTVKYESSIVMMWGYFAASGPGQLDIILTNNIRSSDWPILKEFWFMSQDNNLKDKSKANLGKA